MTRWSFNNALAQKHTPFGQISQHDWSTATNTASTKYRFFALYLLYQYFKLAFEKNKKRYLVKALTEPTYLMAYT